MFYLNLFINVYLLLVKHNSVLLPPLKLIKFYKDSEGRGEREQNIRQIEIKYNTNILDRIRTQPKNSVIMWKLKKCLIALHQYLINNFKKCQFG